MRTTDVEMILETFDHAENKPKAIANLANMLKVDVDVIKEKLQQNGRRLDYAQIKPKKKKDPEAAAPEKEIPSNISKPCEELPMPEYVKDILFKEVARLETRLDELQTEYKEAQKNYVSLRDYLHL